MSVRVCERSVNDDELAAVCTACTVSVVKSQQCRMLHRAEKYSTFVASTVLKDGSFLMLIKCTNAADLAGEMLFGSVIS